VKPLMDDQYLNIEILTSEGFHELTFISLKFGHLLINIQWPPISRYKEDMRPKYLVQLHMGTLAAILPFQLLVDPLGISLSVTI